MMMAPPMPVPRATSITSRYPRAAPNLASAQAEAFASFSTTTSRPRRSSTRCWSGSSRQARFGANSMVARALSTNPAALRCFQTVGGWLGQGLADLAAVLDPACFVIGGGVSEAGELLLDPARTAFERALPGRGHRPLAEIKVAQLGEDAGIVGAADLARESGQNAVFTRRRRRRRRLGRPILVRSYAARVWRSL